MVAQSNERENRTGVEHGPDLCPLCILTINFLEHDPVKGGDQLVGKHTQDDRLARASTRFGDSSDLCSGPRILGTFIPFTESGDPLHQALSRLSNDIREREEFRVQGVGSRDGPAVRSGMARGAGSREAERTCREGLDNLGAHGVQFVVIGLLIFIPSSFPHCVLSQRGVPDQTGSVHAERSRREAIEIAAVGRPIKGDSGENALIGDFFDGLEGAGQALDIPLAHGRKRHAAISNHDARGTVPTTWARERIPEELGVEVSVRIDEAGCHDPSRGVDGAQSGATGTQIANFDDTIPLDSHIRQIGRLPCPIDDGAISNQ